MRILIFILYLSIFSQLLNADVGQGLKTDTNGNLAVNCITGCSSSSGPSSVTILTGTSTIGTVNIASGTTTFNIGNTVPISVASLPSAPVTNAGTFAVQATQVTSPWVTTIQTGTSTIGSVNIATGGSTVSTVPAAGNTWPVSIASLPSGAVTQGTSPWVTSVQSGASISLLTGTSTIGTVNIASGSTTFNIGNTIPVTIATLPSGAVTNAGTFAVQATQTTSPWVTQDLASGSSVASAPTKTMLVGGVFNNTPQTLTNNQMGDLQLDSSQNLLINLNKLPTLTKGSQGATGLSVQSLMDAGRSTITLYATGAAAGSTTVETLISLTRSAGTLATGASTSTLIDNGKTFRITSIIFGTQDNASTGTIETTIFNLRLNTSGLISTNTTPIIMSVRSANGATAGAYDRIVVPVSAGLEIVGGANVNIGVSANATYVTNAPTWDVLITGFEY